MKRPVIVLEFNELCPSLMDRFIAQGLLPNFARLRSQSRVHLTDAEEKAPNLEPWIQWVTVHTGLGFEEHGVFDLDDGHKVNAPRLWDRVSQAGGKVLVCGSMNPGYEPGLRGQVIPDPWSTGVAPYPPGEFEVYCDYVRTNVQEHTRSKVPLRKTDHLRFLYFMLTHGLSAATIAKTLRQLASERGGRNRWKRATILDRMQWDLFRHYWKRDRPDYATFFVNSTAHFQHSYWRNMEPEMFRVQPTSEEQAEYSGAVLYGYQQMDGIVGECLHLAGGETTVVLCTALSQQACVIYEETGGKVIYRPHDPDQLLRWAQVAGPWRHAPVMAEQFHLYFPTEEAAIAAQRRLESLRMDGRPMMLARRDGQSIFAGSQVFHKLDDADARMTCGETGVEIRFLDLFYPIKGMKSGMHHPDGIFWVREPGQAAGTAAERIPLRAVAPRLLELFGLGDAARAVPGAPMGRGTGA